MYVLHIGLLPSLAANGIPKLLGSEGRGPWNFTLGDSTVHVHGSWDDWGPDGVGSQVIPRTTHVFATVPERFDHTVANLGDHIRVAYSEYVTLQQWVQDLRRDLTTHSDNARLSDWSTFTLSEDWSTEVATEHHDGVRSYLTGR
jgi:hypothetical protein